MALGTMELERSQINLFKNYLEHRQQFVINKDTKSDYQSTNCGVP